MGKQRKTWKEFISYGVVVKCEMKGERVCVYPGCQRFSKRRASSFPGPFPYPGGRGREKALGTRMREEP